MSRSDRSYWEYRSEDAPPAWLVRREILLRDAIDNPLYRLILFRRHRSDRLQLSILSYLIFGLGGAAIATFGALTWPVAAWFLATWSILSLEIADRPGWVAPRGSGLGGMTSLPKQAVEDLNLAGYEPASMSVALWASTLSRSLIVLWAALLLVGVATCWGRLLGIARAGEITPVSWLWTIPLGYLSFRSTLRLTTPCNTLPHCVNLLEYARIQWWRRHRPLKYLLQASLTLARHLLMVGALLLIGAAIGTSFGDVYARLPFDPNRPANLLAAGVAAMILGLLMGAFYRRVLEGRRDHYLGRAAELIGWLIEQERASADAVAGVVGPRGRPAGPDGPKAS